MSLSLEAIIVGNAIPNLEHWDSKGRSTICPSSRARCFSFNQVGVFCEAPGYSSHQKLFLSKMHFPA